jgi:WD40 repeat protein
VVLWDVAARSKKTAVKGEAVTAVAFSPDNSRIASGERYKKVKLFDGTGKELKALDGHDAAILAVAFSPDNKVLYSFSLDGGLRTWDASSGAPQGAPQKVPDSHSAAAFSPDGKFLLAGTSGGNLYFYSLATKKIVFKGQLSTQVKAVAISPDGKTLAVGLGDETIRLLDTTGKEQGKVAAVDANGLAFSADGKRLAAAGHDGDVYAIAVESKTVLARMKGHDRTVRAVCFVPDGSAIVSASFDKTVRIWPAS